MGRPRMYDEALRERLVEEARKMLTEEGYHGVSLRVLTRNVGTSTNAVYTLFGSKEALMAEIVVRDLNEMLESGFQPSRTSDLQADLMKMARFYREHAISDPRAFSGAFEAMEEAERPGSLTGRINPEVRNIGVRLHAPMLEECTRIAAEHPDLNLDPTRMAIALWAAIHGFVALENAHALPSDPEESQEIFDQTVNALYRGWIAESPREDASGKDSPKKRYAVKVADTEADTSHA